MKSSTLPMGRKVRGEFTSHVSQLPGTAERSAQLLEMASSLLPKYGPNWHRHSLVTMRVEALARLLYYNELYQMILDVPGVICEFGVQWGATMSELVNLRNIYEPFNVSRTIIGFDTFEGFPSVNPEDGGFSSVGDYSSLAGFEKQLEEILSLVESFGPIPTLRRFALVKGDASETISTWLNENPHAIISMAIFDMDIYAPTKAVLEAIRPRMVKGSLLVFDELNCPQFPGETRALDEVLGLSNLALRRSKLQPYCAWTVM